MFGILVEKELKNILLSPKFVSTFGVCALLILLSMFVGIQEYKASVEQYETAMQLTEQQVREGTSWWGINNQAYRAPDPMQIFVSGVNNDVGRFSDISTWREVKLESSNYADDTLFAVFRFIDLVFIVQVVLSLFAILFTYDAINGERESGTLKLSFSNAIPRGQYMLSKFVGSWLGLTVPLLIPILLGLLLVMVMSVPMEAVHWAKVGTLIGSSILYFTFFIALGLLVSSLTKRSSVSFLILLVMWVMLVLIVPRGATMAAGQLVPVMSVAEVESQKDRFQTDRWSQFGNERSEIWEGRRQEMAGMDEQQQQQYQDQNREAWREEDDAARQRAQEDMAEFTRMLNEQLRNEKAEQERMAFILSRFSPASAYQLTVMNLGGTNITLKTRYEDAMQSYREQFNQFVDDKRDEERKKMEQQARRSGGGMRVMFGGGGSDQLDVAEMPRFESPEHTFEEAIAPSVIDFGLLALFSITTFAGAFLAFLRYDVR